MPKKLKIILLLMAAVFLIAILPGCTQKNDTKEISIEIEKGVVAKDTASHEVNGEKPLRIAIGSMITPKDGYVYYKQLLQYIEKKIGREVKLVDRDSYAEVNALLNSGNIDVAFVCGGPYVDGHDKFGLELLVVPQTEGKSVYYSYIIVHIDSPIKSFQNLRGKTFAFADPDSNTGKIVPTYILSLMKETPESYFKEYIFTYAHDKSIRAVAQNLVDGAAVDSLIWEYYNINNPQVTSKTRIILKNGPYGIPPVVVSPVTDPETKKRLSDILLNLHNDAEGRAILQGMMIDKFVYSKDSAYNSIREIKAQIP